MVRSMKKNYTCILLSIVFLNAIGISFSNQVDGSDWPRFHHDLENTGFTLSSAPPTNNVLWRWNETVTSSYISSPIIAEGKIYVCIAKSTYSVYCLDVSTGQEQWDINIGSAIHRAPVFADDKIFVVSEGKIVCIDSTTVQILWSNSSYSIRFSSPAYYNGKLYVGDMYGNVLCINANTGEKIWEFPTNAGSLSSSPAIANDCVYICSYADGKLYCLDAIGTGDGKTSEIWSFSTGVQNLKSSPILYNNYVYLSGHPLDRLYCLNTAVEASQRIRWDYPILYGSFIAATAYGNVYITNSNQLFCVNATGNGDGSTTTVWNISLPTSGLNLNAPIVADQKIYLMDYDGTQPFDSNLYCVNTQGNLLWSYQIKNTRPPNSAPLAIADNKLFVTTSSYPAQSAYLYCFRANSPPEKPQIPQGKNNGVIGEQIIFTTKAAEPDNDQLWYQWQLGDAYTTDWLGPYHSDELVKIEYTWETPGTYLVKVKAKDMYNLESIFSFSHSITIAQDSLDSLRLFSPKSVLEKQEFIVKVTKQDGSAIEGVHIEFLENSQLSDAAGEVVFTAPEVDQDTPYIIKATHPKFISASSIITISNTQPQQNGYVYGCVQSISGVLLDNVQIRFSTSGFTKYVNTDDHGQYVLALPAGVYKATALRSEYQTKILSQLHIEAGVASEINILLESQDPLPTTSGDSGYIHFTLNRYIDEGRIGAKIDVLSEDQPAVYTYISDISVNVESMQNMISCTVSAPEGTDATLIVFSIQKDFFDSNELIIMYDNEQIYEERDVELFFDLDSSTDPCYLLLTTLQGERYAFVRIPHFSEHHIRISSVIKTILGMNPMIFYLVVTVFIAVVFVGAGEISKRW